MGKVKAARHHPYSVGTTPSLRWAGVEGQIALCDVTGGDQPRISIRGDRAGEISFAIEDIRYLRVAKEFGRTTHLRCVIARNGGTDVVLNGSAGLEYPALVQRLSDELNALGRPNRIQRGLRWWENMIHLAIFGGLCLLLLYAPYDTYVTYGADWRQTELLIAGVLALAAFLGLIGVLSLWHRWYRVRRVEHAADLARFWT
ncbi:hypothetical protein [Sphingopyxis fribergensis]